MRSKISSRNKNVFSTLWLREISTFWHNADRSVQTVLLTKQSIAVYASWRVLDSKSGPNSDCQRLWDEFKKIFTLIRRINGSCDLMWFHSSYYVLKLLFHLWNFEFWWRRSIQARSSSLNVALLMFLKTDLKFSLMPLLVFDFFISLIDLKMLTKKRKWPC